MLAKRPWINGEILKMKQHSDEDNLGIDMFARFDESLADILCMNQEDRGMKFQVKSQLKKENAFRHGYNALGQLYENQMLNLGTRDNIFVLNGQEEESLMLATLVGQIVAMAGLTGDVSESIILGFLAEDMLDEEAVLAYIKHREYLIKEKWFKKWLIGFKIKKWKELSLTILPPIN